MYPEPGHEEWTRHYARYADEISDFVGTRVPAPERDDILQELWASLATTLSGQSLTAPRAWLYRAARNRIADLYRRRARRPDFLDVSEQTEPATELPEARDPDDLMDEIDEALAFLPETQREVFVRNELEGETLREIADDLGIPLKTAISRKGYARRRLRDLLADTYADYFGPE
jgi:RNA polymerase sigma factor (sigma-70 family)